MVNFFFLWCDKGLSHFLRASAWVVEEEERSESANKEEKLWLVALACYELLFEGLTVVLAVLFFWFFLDSWPFRFRGGEKEAEKRSRGEDSLFSKSFME